MSRLNTVFAALALVACGAQPRTPAEAPEAPAVQPAAPYAGALTLRHGGARAQAEGPWSELPAGTPTPGVRTLETGSRGAVLDLSRAGAPDGRLWLQAGTRVHLSADAQGRLEAAVESGAARLRTFSPEGRDVTLAPNRSPLPTAASPRAADWSADLLSEPAPVGVGSLTPGDAVAQLDLVGLHVRARRNGDLADVEVEHRFYSHADAPIEGTFRFPLPADALLTGLAMEIDGQLMEGELVEREKARRVYDEIVDQMQDPALLEWESGNQFKLRVFPIEPRQEKRVVLRYSVPLVEGSAGWEFRYATAAPAMKQTIGRYSVAFDGRPVVDRADYAPGDVTRVPVDAPAAAHAVTREGERYTSMRVRATWPAAAPGPRAPRLVVVFVDTSRSALESQPLARQAVQILLGELDPADRFVLLSGDVVTRRHGEGPASPTAANRQAADDALAEIECDGASDLGAAFGAIARALSAPRDPALRPEVVYLGDGVVTWGAGDAEALAAQVAGLGAPLHAVALERDADVAALRRLAAGTGGVVVAPRTLPEVRRFATRLATTRAEDRLTDVVVKAPDGFVAYPDTPTTLFRGDTLTVSLKGPAEAAPQQVEVRGLRGATPVTLAVPVGEPQSGGRADQRWARHYLASLQSQKAEKDEVVAASLRYQVMSKHTAFLVLESEEAYRQHEIERKNAAAPRIAGADLESDGERTADLSHDHIQPGDPEVRVPAPADAREVWVFFPFGDVHRATWEPALGLWTTRFLISKETPDGVYFIHVRVTHADGAVELIKLRYVVDTLKPAVEVRLTRRRGKVRIEARQIVRAGELVREGIAVDDLDAAKARHAHVVADLRRVDVRLPDGKILPLRALRTGHFRGDWRPEGELPEWLELTVVAHDKALNANPQVFTLNPRDRAWQLADEGGAR